MKWLSSLAELAEALQGPVQWIADPAENTTRAASVLHKVTREQCEDFIMSSSSSSILNTTTVLAVCSTAALLYLQWQNVPKWMKLGFGGGTSTKQGEGARDAIDGDANDHLATIPAVLAKLKEMNAILDKIDSAPKGNDLDEIDFMLALYSLLHLYTEIETKDPDYRDKEYEDGRQAGNVGLEEVKELVEYLEYAHWAYQKTPLEENCKNAGLHLITQDIATEPGRVGHYVACRHDEKLVIIGLKGTSTFSDVLTDLIGIPKEHVGCYFDDKTFAAPKAGDDQSAAGKMFCHEGIFTAAIWMADHLQPMIENLFVPLNYKVVICGHSLGAGTACLLGLELRSRIKAFRRNYTDLRVLAFATPPVVSYNASKACAPFVTSVVNNADIICRCSVANLVVMDKLLMKVHYRLAEKGLRVNSWAALKRYYEEHSTIDDDLLLTEDELDAFFEETHAAPENETEALFVPGRVVVVWDKGENDNHEMGGIVTDCGMRMLRQFEMRFTMITDHLVNLGYRPNLQKLLNQLENAK